MTNNSVIRWYFSLLFSQHAQFPLLYKYAWKKLESFVFQNSHMENLNCSPYLEACVQWLRALNLAE